MNLSKFINLFLCLIACFVMILFSGTENSVSISSPSASVYEETGKTTSI